MVTRLRATRTLVLAIGLACILIFALFGRDSDPGSATSPADGGTRHRGSNVAIRPQQNQNARKVELVVASMKKDDTSWFERYLPGLHVNKYVVDDPLAPLTVPKNKGHEAMVYLTYIIDRYDGVLPDVTVFVHASRFAWHNDDPDYDALPTLRNLRIPYVREAGYVNLRCVWVIGCPAEIRPFEDEGLGTGIQFGAKSVYKEAFQELMPGVPVPELVAVSCCSQFAVTRETVRRNPREDYVRIRKWLLETKHEDEVSGRVMEFLWHILFGKNAYHCPSARECYCNVWGLCNLTCSSEENECEGRYTLPTQANLPEGWPRIGWEGEDRPFSGPLD